MIYLIIFIHLTLSIESVLLTFEEALRVNTVCEVFCIVPVLTKGVQLTISFTDKTGNI